MDYSTFSNQKVSFYKYKGKTFYELSLEIITNDKKYLNTISKTLNAVKTTNDKKKEVQDFLNYFYNFFEPNYQPSTQVEVNEILSSLQNEITSQSPSFWNPDYCTLSTNLEKITHIFHISDIHIRLYNRHKEYQDVFDKLYKLLEEKISINPFQIIIITGDLLHSKNNLSPECILSTQNFLLKLSSITTTLLIAGNHDALLTNNQREDSITAIVENVNIPNFYYLRNSAVYYLANLSISVNSLLDNKWIYASSFANPPEITHKIALYHGGVGLVETGVGHRLRGERLVEDFDGYDYVLLGDIHKFQFLDPEKKRLAYSSSLIAQNFNEWNSPHGALLWDLFHQNHIYYPIENKHGFFVFNLINNHIFVEEELISSDQIYQYLQNMNSSVNVKLNIKNCSPEFISKINYLVKACATDVKIIHNFLGNKEKTNTQEEEMALDLPSIQSLLANHLRKTYPNIQPEEISFILQKYQEYHSDSEIFNEKSLSRWELLDLEFSNLFGYGQDNYIDFSRFTSNSPIGIIAPNSHGKSSLIDIILFTLFSKFSRSRGTGVSKDIININCSSFYSKLRFKIGSNIYVIIKEGKREQTDKIKITKNEFYSINEDQMELLNDEDRRKTDKVINDLIGSYDDFIFTNVQLQNRTNSFKEMTDKERKEYLYKVLKLNIWNEMVKKISESIKPIKNSVSYLEKYLENKSMESLDENIQEFELKIQVCQDDISQQMYEKQINQEKQEDERGKIQNCSAEKHDEKELSSKIVKIEKTLKESQQELKNYQHKLMELNERVFPLISELEIITQNYNDGKNKMENSVSILNSQLEKLTQNAIIPTNNLWKKLSIFHSKEPSEILTEIKFQKSKSQEIITEKSFYLNSNDFINSIDNLSSEIIYQKQDLQNKSNEKIILNSKIIKFSKSDEELIKKESNLQELTNQLRLKNKEKEVIENKIHNFSEELKNFDQDSYKKWKEEEPKRQEIYQKLQQEKDLQSILTQLENHEYDPKCKFCIQHPIVKQKSEKKEELKQLQILIKSLQKNIHFSEENGKKLEEDKIKFNQTQDKLSEKKQKLIIVENTVGKLEIEIERAKNLLEKVDRILIQKSENEEILRKINELEEEIKKLSSLILKKQQELSFLEQKRKNNEEIIKSEKDNLEKLNSYQEIILEIMEINAKNNLIQQENQKITDLKKKIEDENTSFYSSDTNQIFQKLQNELREEMQINLEKAKIENKLQEQEYQKSNKETEIQNLQNILTQIEESKHIAKNNLKIKENIDKLQAKINLNDKNMAKLNENLGVLQEKYKSSQEELLKFQENMVEFKTKKNELKLLQILEQSLGKDGLPLAILQNYLSPITQSINNIISPFISRIINLRVENDDLLLDSFPSNSAERSVYMHGGMESFILDIAFKITLSNFAKLPKCDILFLDEGISAFDNERLSNIDVLFDFIRKYFSKTILITHIDTVKESINEKIGIIKQNNFSKIVCEYLS